MPLAPRPIVSSTLFPFSRVVMSRRKGTNGAKERVIFASMMHCISGKE